MSTNGWVLAPRFTACFAGALVLLIGAAAGALVEPARMAASAGLTRGFLAAATALGTALAAATVVAMNRQTRRWMAADQERDRLLRAETARAEGAAAESARTLEALRLSWEELLQSSERARRDNERLRHAQAELEGASRAKDEFLAVLSHELRSPLHAMLGWLAILKKGLAAGHNVDRAVATVERNLQLQAGLVNDLLDVSRIVTSQLAIEEEPVDLPLVIHGAVESARPAAAVKGVELTCVVALPPGAVIGDERRLRQVVGNLLGNAVKLTPRGGRVGVTLASREGDVVLEVRDTGAGIAKDFLPHLFERFRQADGSSTRAHQGLGLGLSIAKTLVELHGGRVEAASDGPGRGSTFTVRLPLRAASLAPLPAPAGEPHGPAALASVTVMLVDDDPDGREALQLALEHAGAGVHAFGSAAEARREMARVAPDVIVSDIGMPGEDGYAFLRTVRAGGDGCVPAVAITGFAGKQDREAALRAGFDDHIAKPVDADALIAKLRELVRRSGPRVREAREAPALAGSGKASPSPPPAPARRA